MSSRKRQASDTLLPLRAPKHPRTTRDHYLGGNSSPSQFEALSARWGRLAMDFFKLLRDSVTQAFEPPAPTPEDVGRPSVKATVIPSPPPSPPPPPPPPQVSSSGPPRRVSALPVLRLPATTHPTSHVDAPAPASAGSTKTLAPPPDATPTQGSSAPQPSGEGPVSPRFVRKGSEPQANAQPNGVITPPSTDSSTSARETAINMYPELSAALNRPHVRRRRSPEAGAGAGKRYIQREHIHAKMHKAQVLEERKRAREEMEKDLYELYQLKRSSGYASDMNSFRSLMDYRARLEMLERKEALSPSPSLIDLRAKPPPLEPNRRHSISHLIDADFLHRAIEKARESLNGPKPPKPFVPTLDQLRLSALTLDEEIDRRLHGPKRKPLPAALPPEDEAVVDALFARRGVIARCAREQVLDKDVARLRPCQWLNDEVINFYGQMIQTRAEGGKENPPAAGARRPLNAHYFSTFFWSKLKGEGYEKARLAKWTKKIDIFEKDVVLIPINHNNAHWTAAAINFRRRRIESYDSMGMERQNVFKLLRVYLDAEHRNKKKKPFDFTGWEDYTLSDTPQQENGYDCGVFTCQFLEALSRGEEMFPFTQSNMPYLRRRMVWEIGHVKLRDDW
ncbi:Sentrin-specific protease 1 [Grifola frondosa]|uniref:Sentrin-specific protease 1 n=1 Tax=Grifola frondosa TaxID=5627 RepID=A0A1C7MRG0_GRIFR|nr:Sentrin-specific protease 1 [Grifola frondosa]